MTSQGRKDLIAALDQAFPAPPQHLAVAVSGGSDSVALLHLVTQWDRSAVQAVTVNHHLRAGALDEVAAVARLCADLDIPHTVLNWTDWTGEGNLQDQARRARYRLLGSWASDAGVNHMALGHTQDDNAETFLMGLARGAGLDGLSGMRPCFVHGEVVFHRPLLGIARQTLRDELLASNIPWANDPSNDDTRFERVKMRQLLPALQEVGIGADQIARSMSHLRTTRRDLGRDLLKQLHGEMQIEDGDVVIPVETFRGLSNDSARRFLNATLRWVAGTDYPPRAAKVMRLVQAPGEATLHGCRVLVDATSLRITREYAAVADLVTDSSRIWDDRWRIDGPHAPDLEIRATGEAGLRACPDWRDTKRPRASLISAPSIWKGPDLIAAPHLTDLSRWRTKLLRDEKHLHAAFVTH